MGAVAKPDPASTLSAEAIAAVAELKQADIVIGIPSYNNVRTIGHVVRAAHAGLQKYFPQYTSVIINSDGGSKDGTPAVVLGVEAADPQLLLLNTPLSAVHRLSFPYHGVPGKGSAFRMIFQMASDLNARACCVVDSDLRSITPEWFDLLIRPVLHHGYDFVAPYYHRHKYDGTITNSIIYPLTRALYGHRIRQPIGGDFGMSTAIVRRYLKHDDWESDVARFGIDIWMTTTAVAEDFRVCQSFLGAKLHDAKDPGSDLSAMLQQVLSSLFALTARYEPAWRARSGSEPSELFGFRYDVGLDPIAVNVERMLTIFRKGAEDLHDVWKLALSPSTLMALAALARATEEPGALETFHISDRLWTRIVYEFAAAWHRLPLERGHILRSFTPLYMGRVASWVIETKPLDAAAVEERMEQLCVAFESMKPYLVDLWDNPDAPHPDDLTHAAKEASRVRDDQ
ncbi:MAG TPA: cell wall biosynthesis glycosyltransferase [Bryobacteraceae bacterium]|nr:cell wall biosynthesis glycosyltransferase [Bryobacteraceae bacterium]